MVKFVKGIYAFTREEVEQLIKKYNNNEFINMGRKNYIQLHVKQDLEPCKDEIEKYILEGYIKTKIIEKLKTTFYKFEKYCVKKYGTNNLNEIKNKLTPQF